MIRSLLFTPATRASATPALANSDDSVPTRRVSYADLDLSTEAGRTTLNRRVEIAVRQNCRATDAKFRGRSSGAASRGAHVPTARLAMR